MKEKYFEITLVDYDENNVPCNSQSVYCRAFERITVKDAMEFCRDDLGLSFEGVFKVEEISHEEAEEFADDEVVTVPFVDASRVWKIPVTYSVSGVVEVKADTLEDAMDMVYIKDGSIPLPEDAEYVPGSWELSETDVDFVRECYNNNRQDPV